MSENARPRRSTDAVPEEPERRRRPSAVSRLLTWLGVLLLATGLACFGYIGYQYWGTNIVADKQAQQQRDTVRDRWAKDEAGKSTPDKKTGTKVTEIEGGVFALLRIPVLGSGYEKPILVGTDMGTLAKGVGWYRETAQPGAIGNFALAGHRVTHGEPFARLLELPAGAEVIIETKDAIYTYVVDAPASKLTVNDTETWVIAPNPQDPDTEPTKAIITLTTCQDLFHSPDRSVAFGHLAKTEEKHA